MLVRYCDLCKKEICRGEGGTVRTPEVFVQKRNYLDTYDDMDICYVCSCKLKDIFNNFSYVCKMLEEGE